jgi:hypothetical protein
VTLSLSHHRRAQTKGSPRRTGWEGALAGPSPTPLSAITSKVRSCPRGSTPPAKARGLAAPTTSALDPVISRQRTRYPVTGKPPFEEGGPKATVTEPVVWSGVTASRVGAPGAVVAAPGHRQQFQAISLN